jgi:hypothetical protein
MFSLFRFISAPSGSIWLRLEPRFNFMPHEVQAAVDAFGGRKSVLLAPSPQRHSADVEDFAQRWPRHPPGFLRGSITLLGRLRATLASGFIAQGAGQSIYRFEFLQCTASEWFDRS